MKTKKDNKMLTRIVVNRVINQLVDLTRKKKMKGVDQPYISKLFRLIQKLPNDHKIDPIEDMTPDVDLDALYDLLYEMINEKQPKE